jgi:hypothetical protein
MFKSDLLKKLSAVVLLFTVVAACKNTKSTSTETPKEPEKTLTVLKTDDGKFQISLPDGWSKASDLNDKADLQAWNKTKAMYAIVLIENAEDLAGSMTLDKFTDITKKSLMSKYESPVASTPESVSINGSEGRQYELKGTKETTALDLLVTTVKSPNSYSQIITWTVPSKMADNKTTLKQVTESFKEAKK